MSRFIGVLGPGRCGSSMVAGMLHHAGVPMGHDMIGPHPRNNPTGHFEDFVYHRLNREIVYRLDNHPALDCETLRHYPLDGDTRPWDGIIAEYDAQINRHDNGAVWGIKCGFLGAAWPFIYRLFPTDVRFVMVHRKFSNIIHSRIDHTEIPEEQAVVLTTWLTERALRVISDAKYPVCHIQYEDVLVNPLEEAAALCKFAGIADHAAAAAFVRPELNHCAEMIPA